MNPLGLALTIFFSAMAWVGSKRVAALGVFGGICYLTQGQMIPVAGFHFTAIRFVLLAGLVRVLSRGEWAALKRSIIDKAVVRFVTIGSVIYIVREGSVGAMVSQIGIIYNIVLSYFVFRCLLPTFAAVEELLASLAYFLIPFVVCMVLESISGHNLFYIFGSVAYTDENRNGHYRCSAAFRSPITGGTFGATLFPLFFGLFWATTKRTMGLVGFISGIIITVCSRSSGPALELLAGIVALLIWNLRQHTQLLRRGFVVGLVIMHLIMKAPVWFLMGHMSDLIGGGGWHRAEIIDAAVNHFSSWFLAGTDQTGDWVGTQLAFGGADLTNQFVSEGVNGGLVTMLLFTWIIVRAFQELGRSMNQFPEKSERKKVLWCLGVGLMGTVVNFFSVSYFDQIETVWLFLVAVIAGATADEADNPAVTPVDEVEESSGGPAFPSRFGNFLPPKTSS